MGECRHLIKCAVTGEEREAVKAALENARATGDSRGVMIALGQLTGPCCGSGGSAPVPEDGGGDGKA